MPYTVVEADKERPGIPQEDYPREDYPQIPSITPEITGYEQPSLMQQPKVSEKWSETILRNIARGATALARPLDIPANIGNILGGLLPEGISQKEIEILDIPETFKERLQEARKIHTAQLPEVVPTLKKLLPEEWRDPRAGYEEIIDNVIGTIPMIIGLGGPASSLGGSIAITTAGESVGNELKKKNYGIGVQLAANWGTQLLLGGLTRMRPQDIIKRASKTENSLYNESNKLAGKDWLNRESTDILTNKINNYYDRFSYPSKINKEITTHLNEVSTTVAAGRPLIKKLMKLKKDINTEAFRKGTHLDVRKALKEISYNIKEGLQDYAMTNRPFQRAYFDGAENLAQGLGEFKRGLADINKDVKLKDFVSAGVIGNIYKGVKNIPKILFGKAAPLSKEYVKLGLKAPKEIIPTMIEGWIDTLVGNKAGMLSNFEKVDKALKSSKLPQKGKYTIIGID